jgi:hypothetical protein
MKLTDDDADKAGHLLHIVDVTIHCGMTEPWGTLDIALHICHHSGIDYLSPCRLNI